MCSQMATPDTTYALGDTVQFVQATPGSDYLWQYGDQGQIVSIDTFQTVQSCWITAQKDFPDGQYEVFDPENVILLSRPASPKYPESLSSRLSMSPSPEF